MSLVHTMVQTHRHYRNDVLSPVTVEEARALNYPLVADCGKVWIPGLEEETRALPMCPACERVNAKPAPVESSRRGSHRTPVAIRATFPHYVYRCYDEQDRLLYVGCTYTPLARMRQHKADGKKWVHKVARTRLIVFPDRRKALDMERLAIETEHPIHNRQFKRVS